MSASWPVVTVSEAADLQEFVSEYKHCLGREALWKVAQVVAVEAGVELQYFDSWDEVETQPGTDSTSANSECSPGADGAFEGGVPESGGRTAQGSG